MILREKMLQFDFSGAINAFKFDEETKTLPTYHGLSHCMKAVDFVVEYDDHYLFVEIKDPPTTGRYDSEKDQASLVRSLTTKFRDTFLYRWAEEKLDKPVQYLCLVEIDNALTLFLTKQLEIQLPTVEQPSRWRRPLVFSCAVLNQRTWNKTFPNMPLTR